MAAEHVADDWREALEDLREPSEATISNLVSIARDALEYANAIAMTTIEHIKKVKSSQAKLNTFYVVDAIVKRIRSPYTMYFGHNLYSMFMDAYQTMDAKHRKLMDSLFKTWIAPVPGSLTRELVFDPQYTQRIGSVLQQWHAITQPQQPQQPQHQQRNPPIPIQRQQQHYQQPPPQQQQPQIDYQNHRPSPPPWPTQPNQQQYPSHPPALQYLPSSTPVPHYPPPQHQLPYYPPVQPPTPQNQPSHTHIPPYQPPTQYVSTYSNPQSLISQLQSQPPQNTWPPPNYSTPPPTLPPPPAPGGTDIAAMLIAGLMGTGAPPPLSASTPVPTSSTPDLFNPATLRTPHPNLIDRLYADKPDQCRQCGRRFANDAAGKEAKAAHLDWHFKTNSRVSESQVQRGVINRSWYIGEAEWISYREAPDGSGQPLASDPSSTSHNNGGGASSATTSSKAQSVRVPEVVTNGGICLICQDKFTTRYDGEFWVWDDAVKVGNKYYHASCYADAMKGQALAQAVASNGSKRGSARNTPEPSGVKRRKV